MLHFLQHLTSFLTLHYYLNSFTPIKMASSTLSNITICHPFDKVTTHPYKFKIQPWPRNNKLLFLNSLKAMAGGKPDSLDYLQMPSFQKPQPKQIQPKVAPPTEPLNRTKTVQRQDPIDYISTWPLVSVRRRDGYSSGRTPWAIKEMDDKYKLRFDMPGMSKDDVKVWLEENMLVFNAEKVVSNENKQGEDSGNAEEEWPSAESFGRYSTRIALPENIDFENIKAKVKDGVLYLTIPKAVTDNKISVIQVE